MFCAKNAFNFDFIDSCPENTFQCSSNGDCLPKSHICDGYSDCPRAEDEADCRKYSIL